MGKVPKMREASGPLLTFVLQPLEDPGPGASALVQLSVDLFKHVLHLPRRRFVKLLLGKTQKGSGHHTDWVSESCVFSVCLWVQITSASLFISAE